MPDDVPPFLRLYGSSPSPGGVVDLAEVEHNQQHPYTLCKTVTSALCFPLRSRGLSRALKTLHWSVFARRSGRRALYGLRCPHRLAPLGAGRYLCDRCPCSGSLLPPQAAVASAAVLVPDGAQTVAASRIIAIKKSPTSSVRLCSGNTSTSGTLCLLLHSPGTLPRSKNAPLERFCPPERTAGTSCSHPSMVHQLYIPDYCNKKTALRFP